MELAARLGQSARGYRLLSSHLDGGAWQPSRWGQCWPSLRILIACLLDVSTTNPEKELRRLLVQTACFLSLTNELELQKQFSLGINIQVPTAKAEALNELSRGRLRRMRLPGTWFSLDFLSWQLTAN